MLKIGITYDELLEIYAINGHQVKQPNSVKAIAHALTTISKRIVDMVDARFNDYANVLVELQGKVAELQGLVVQQAAGAPRRATGAGKLCYCGTFVQASDERCPTCHAR